MSGWGLILGLLVASAAEPVQGRLRKFEEPFRGGGGGGPSGGRDSDDSSRRQSSDQDDDDSYDHDDWDSDSSSSGRTRSGTGFDNAGPFWLLAYPFFDHRLRFEEFPYAQEPDDGEDRRGVYYLSDLESGKEWSFDLRPYSLRVDEDLFAVGLAGTARNGSGGNFRFDVAQYREDVGGRTDDLILHKYELNYGPGRGPRNYHWTFGIGVGMLDGVETHAGFQVQAAAEWYPFNPLSLRAGAAWIFYEEADLADLEAELRVHVHRVALGFGIRSLINSEGGDLTGPMVSLTFWF